jgi:hypothetical protein
VLILADLRGLLWCVCTVSIVWRANALQMIWVVWVGFWGWFGCDVGTNRRDRVHVGGDVGTIVLYRVHVYIALL